MAFLPYVITSVSCHSSFVRPSVTKWVGRISQERVDLEPQIVTRTSLSTYTVVPEITSLATLDQKLSRKIVENSVSDCDFESMFSVAVLPFCCNLFTYAGHSCFWSTDFSAFHGMKCSSCCYIHSPDGDTLQGTDINSDHEFVMMIMKVKLTENVRNHGPRLKFDHEKRKDPQAADLFEATVGGTFAAPNLLEENIDNLTLHLKYLAKPGRRRDHGWIMTSWIYVTREEASRKEEEKMTT